MNIDKISNKTLREKVYDQLRKKIISAEIVPGQVMTLQGLANKFGTSLMPVREALWQLESEKVIVIENNRGIRVNTLTAKEMEEALRIRLILESIAAERSCERRPESALQKIKHLLDRMEASIQRPKSYFALNSLFHFAIYSYADSPMLLQIIDSLWARIGPYLLIKALKGGDFSISLKWHRGMFEAFVEKNEKKIKECLQEDLKQAAKFIIPFLESYTPLSKRNI